MSADTALVVNRLVRVEDVEGGHAVEGGVRHLVVLGLQNEILFLKSWQGGLLHLVDLLFLFLVAVRRRGAVLVLGLQDEGLFHKCWLIL